MSNTIEYCDICEIEMENDLLETCDECARQVCERCRTDNGQATICEWCQMANEEKIEEVNK